MADEQTTPDTQPEIVNLGSITIDRYLDEDGTMSYGVATDDGSGEELDLPTALMIIEMAKLRIIALPLQWMADSQECTCGEDDGDSE